MAVNLALKFSLTILLVAFGLTRIECRKEHAWHCLMDSCCSIDFSKTLKTVDFILYVCGSYDGGEFTCALYLDIGEEMDIMGLAPYGKVDETEYCQRLCESVELCVQSTKFTVDNVDDGSSATWCFNGKIIVQNQTMINENEVCIGFYKETITLPKKLEDYVVKKKLW
ncbi:uncharacterized protein [Eurosta solidaginis]|uniref:uncharacterized protein n=1 Tax=Eurosta solidaginis TaxID=178769 RepID=UPI0035317D5E